MSVSLVSSMIVDFDDVLSGLVRLIECMRKVGNSM